MKKNLNKNLKKKQFTIHYVVVDNNKMILMDNHEIFFHQVPIQYQDVFDLLTNQ